MCGPVVAPDLSRGVAQKEFRHGSSSTALPELSLFCKRHPIDDDDTVESLGSMLGDSSEIQVVLVSWSTL